MAQNHYKQLIHEIISPMGISINGDNLWNTRVHNEKFYSRVIQQGLLGIGESYMDGWWDCDSLDQLTARVLSSRVIEKVNYSNKMIFKLLLAKFNVFARLFINRQNKKRAHKVANHHYNLSNQLFKSMLDKNLNYTCGYWRHAVTLDEAQEAKLQLICDKLYLQPGMKILDIGCGYGAFAKYAASHYGVEVVGVTISEEQLHLARELCAGLPIKLCLMDYRQVTGKFDRIVSLGMFEHVGYKNYARYMNIAQRCLKDDGLFLLHTIGSNNSVFQTNAWTNKYIFPNGMLPSINQIGIAIENLFIMEDWHNFGPHYDKTLMAWYANFNANWEQLKHEFDERFKRMWDFYLLTSAGSFRSRDIQLWQIVFSKQGFTGQYHSIR
jgi:cyclopropane-fatty-acyl-phospholipid synthase